jgi:predicted lipid-binding transport protein (Tim44 family)
MQESPANYLDIILLAVIAGVILYKLYTILGREDDTRPPSDISPRDNQPPESDEAERPPANMTAHPEPRNKPRALPAAPPPKPEPVIADAAVAKVLGNIKAKDAHFSAGSFLTGATMAFEMVLKALQDGDKNTLKNLLSAEVYKDFASELDQREKSGRFPHITLVAVRDADITGAELNQFKAAITVTFATEQVHVVRDKDKRILEGDASQVKSLTDSWIFERDLRSGSPNWTIVAT